jgi:hypothetical protein
MLFGKTSKALYPKTWGEMSLDFKLMFLYHGSMMAMFILGGKLSQKTELVITFVLISTLAAVSQKHRREAGWRWHKPGRREFAFAALGLPLAAVFLYAATPLFPPKEPTFLPWYLAGCGIFAFNALSTLNVVRLSKADFQKDCNDEALHAGATPLQQSETEVPWKKIVRWAFSIFSFAVMLDFCVFFYYFGVCFKNGSPTPTISRTEPLSDHGVTRFVKRDEKEIIDWLQMTSMGGIPTVMVTGALLHFIVGIKLLEGTPTLREWLERRR